MAVCRELDSYARLPQGAARAEGCELILEDGRRVLDLYGGHCVNTLGGGDPGLARVLDEQWRGLSFVTNVMDHPARADFHAAMGALLPDGEWHAFCSNSGAEANENALKIAVAATGRQRVVAFTGAFHGRTAAAHAVSDVAHRVYERSPFDVVRVPFGDAEAATAAIDESVAAVILEPIQSLAGVATATTELLSALREACDRAGAVLIFDEVQTASGRTGEPFATQTFGVVPDVITTAKGVAGGFPVGVTLVVLGLAERLDRGLLGSTFGGGPMALRAAAEVARRIVEPGFLENVRAASDALRAAALKGPVVDVRGAGLLLGLVLEPGLTAARVRDALLVRGILTGTSNDPGVLRLMPPLVLPPAAADQLAAAWTQMEVTA